VRIIVLIEFLIFSTVLAQVYNFHIYNSNNGLDNPSIKCITQDSDGYIWIGTTSTLLKYDGYTFYDLSKTNSDFAFEIFDLARYNDNIWIVTSKNGIYVYNKKSGFTNIHKKNYFISKKIKRLRATASGILFITKENEFYQAVSDSQINRVLSDVNLPRVDFNDIIPIQGGFALASEQGVFLVQYNRIKYKFDSSILKKNSNVKRLEINSKGDLIFVTTDGNLYKIENYQLQNIHTLSFNKTFNSFSLLSSKNDVLWFGFDEGLIRLEGDKKLTIGFNNGLPHQFITSIFEDREENLWVGTLNGIAKLNSLAIQNYPTLFHTTTSSVQKIFRSKNEIYVFSDEGISVFNLQTKSYKNIPFSFSNPNKVNAVLDLDNASKLIATNNGVFSYQNNKIVPSPLNRNLSGLKALSLEKDFSGRVFVGTDSGLFVFKGYQMIDYYSVDDVLPGNLINSIYLTKFNDLYIGTDAGLVKLDEDSRLVLRTGNGLSDNFITSITEDNSNRLWIGTKKGVSSYKNGRFNNFHPRIDGFQIDEIIDVLALNNNEVWIGTPKGIFIIKNGVNFLNITSKDGILSDFVTDLEFDENNNLVFIGTNSGLTVIDLKYLKRPYSKYKIYFVGFSTEKRNYDLNNIILTSDEKQINVFVSIFSFFDERKVIYRYKLKEVEDKWNYLSKTNQIKYKDLPSGKYTLIVQASVDGINWLVDIAELKFEIKSFWFKHVVLYLVITLGFLIVYLFIVGIKSYIKSKSFKVSSKFEKDNVIPLTVINEPKEIINQSQFEKQDENIEELKKRFEERLELFKDLIQKRDTEIELLKMEIERLKEQIALKDKLEEKKFYESEDFTDEIDKTKIEIVVKNSNEADEVKKYVEALEKTNWSIRAAAKLLNLPHSTFHYRLKKLNLLKHK